MWSCSIEVSFKNVQDDHLSTFLPVDRNWKTYSNIKTLELSIRFSEVKRNTCHKHRYMFLEQMGNINGADCTIWELNFTKLRIMC